MRAVVTGGAGFIGSTLVDRLVARGDDVLIIDDLSTGSTDNLADAQATGSGTVELAVADIGETGTAELVAGHRPDVVFHLAAQTDVRLSVDAPVSDARTNVIGLLRVLEGDTQAAPESSCSPPPVAPSTGKPTRHCSPSTRTPPSSPSRPTG